MKRLLLSFLVIALVFCLGGYGGVLWYEQVTEDNSSRPPRANSIQPRFPNAIPKTDAGFRQIVERAAAPPVLASAPAVPAAGHQQGQFASRAIAQAIPVSDRFEEPRYQNAPVPANQNQFVAQPQRFGRPPQQAFQDQSQNFRRDHDLFEAPASPPAFNQNPVHPPTATPPANNRKTVDLTVGMSYLIHVTRKNNSPHQAVEMERLYGGERAIVLDFTERHAMAELRIFAENVEVTSEEGEFQLKCEGRVAVVANQSMLWGEGLQLDDGAFTISQAEVVTPDAIIKSGHSEFEFAVGGISVERIAGDESGDAGEEAEVNNPVEQVDAEQPVATAAPWTTAERIVEVRPENESNGAAPGLPPESEPSL